VQNGLRSPDAAQIARDYSGREPDCNVTGRRFDRRQNGPI